MASPIAFIARNQPKTFHVSYAPVYKTFIPHHIASDASHPLHIAQRRRTAEHRKEGLWWHVTTSVDLSRSSCVRTWARRRLRNALRHELHQRGYDDTGNMVNVAAFKDRPDLLSLLRQGISLDLKGSLKLQVQAPLIPAKYADVCADAGQLIENLLQPFKSAVGGNASRRKMGKSPGQQEFIAIPPRPFDKRRVASKGRPTGNWQAT